MPKLLNLFSNRSIAVKLASMTMVGAICMALVASTVLLIARNQLMTERTERTHAIVDAVWHMADGYQRAAAAGQITEDEAKKRFFAAASYVWYENHTNYVFIYDYDTGIMVANPAIPTLLGKDMRGLKDANVVPDLFDQPAPPSRSSAQHYHDGHRGRLKERFVNAGGIRHRK